MRRSHLAHTLLVGLVVIASLVFCGGRLAAEESGVGAESTAVYTPIHFLPAWSAQGSAMQSRYGYSVASAGDVNGDGFGDIVTGTPFGPNGGSAELYLGSATGLVASPSWTASDVQGFAFGYSVSSAGDVNGDGYADVIVGDSGFADGLGSVGRAYVYLGSAAGLSASPAWTAESDQGGSWFGYSVSTAGDVNGDGFSDVIVGAYNYKNGQAGEGRAYVYLGSAAGLAPTPAWTGEGDLNEAHFGGAVSTAGDVNGDGFSDVIVGAYGYSNGQSEEGRAYVYLGSAAGLAASPAWTAESDVSIAYFGSSVSAAGDVDGDGFADVIVGASRGLRVYVYLGSASGLAMSPAWTAPAGLLAPTAITWGHPVSTAGDVNGDGYSDVVVGSPYYGDGQYHEGQALLFLGSAAGLAPTSAWAAESDQSEALLGISVSAAGDVNGDGVSDVLVGAPYYDVPCNVNGGRAYVYLGVRLGDACVDEDADGDSFSTCLGGDCDDTQASVFPRAPQLCGDGLNNDCHHPGYPSLIGTNESDDDGDGLSECNGDCDDCNPLSAPGLPEICDGKDNDCDGVIPPDEIDHDFDGHFPICAVGTALWDCDDNDPSTYPGAPEICDGKDNNCDGVQPPDDVDADGDGWAICMGDCDDSNSLLNPGMFEECNGIDDDCDGQLGPGEDDDGDGFLGCETGGPRDYDQFDCDDHNPAVYPGAPAVCDGIRGTDCRCASWECTHYTPWCNCNFDPDWDDDGDGFSRCQGDCKDYDSNIHPGAQELCDGDDNDCDGQVDEGFHLGASCDGPDGDLCEEGVTYCSSSGSIMCNDYTPTNNETCNGIDDDCDGAVDEDLGSTTCGTGACQATVVSCLAGVPQICTPGSPTAEVCNGVDDDCDGQIDEDAGIGPVSVSVQPNVLWPPNHRMVDITAEVAAYAECGSGCPDPVVVLTSITSNEPDDAAGDGDGYTTDDVQGAEIGSSDFEFSLRAERAGAGGGRVYTVTYTATDCLGNVVSGSALVLVPHDESGHAEPVAVEVHPDAADPGTLSLAWNAIPGASSYNVVRGRISETRFSGAFTVMEGAECVATGTPEPEVSGGLLDEQPAAGEAFFYLVEYVKGAPSGYGSESSGSELVVASGDSCH